MPARAQTFEWMSVSRKADGRAAFDRQFEKAIRERARLLFNLRYSAADATRRITDGLRWEFDSTIWPKTPPAFLAQVPSWVEDVYRQMTPGKT